MAHVSLRLRLLEWMARTRDGERRAASYKSSERYCGGGRVIAVLARQQRVRELTLGSEE
jgi:hypothetical protein